jgi:aldehyde:ferredoxin oxidoreductase
MVVGRAEKPVYLWISDDQVEIRSAEDLWGLGTYGTTTCLRDRHGRKTRVISCGPAGEKLARIAVIQTETSNAAGQGGYGAVMGSKNLKAVAVRGSGGVTVARPETFMDLCLHASREGETGTRIGWQDFGREAPSGPNYRTRKCGFCATPCVHKLYFGLPTRSNPGLYTAAQHCWGYEGVSANVDVPARAISSDYGLNGWEISYGIIPWLQLCRQHGLIETIDGLEIPVPDKPIGYLRDAAPASGEFLSMLARKIALREDELGDALADGACYAADRLFGGQGIPLLDRIYPRHCGQTEHWGGHWGPGGDVYWPWWLPPVLQWATDTRDPANDTTHQWTEHVQNYLPQSGPLRGPYPLEKTRAVCAKVYGNADVCDPAYEYDPPEAKVIPAIWHTNRGMLVDSLVLCDYEHTRVFSMLSADGAADTALMARLFSAATGLETSEQELDVAGERIWNLHRAIDVRNYARDRRIDESTFDGFMYPGKDDGVTPDRAKLLELLDTYYRLRGWNPANGWPTHAKLEALGLQDVAQELARVGRLG